MYEIYKYIPKQLINSFLYVAIAIILYGIINRIIKKYIIKKINQLPKESYSYKKGNTYQNLFKNIVKFLIICFTFLAILSEIGFDVSSIWAGIGIFSAVLGLAFQDLLKDFISGFTIILENQYALGDTISVGDFKGEVIYLGFKTTRIRNYEGQVKIVSNRHINEVINYNLSTSLAIVNFGISYKQNNDKLEAILNDLCLRLTKELEYLKSDVELLGITEFKDSFLNYRIVVETESMKHYQVERQIRKYLKEELDKHKIEIPFPKIEVHNAK